MATDYQLGFVIGLAILFFLGKALYGRSLAFDRGRFLDSRRQVGALNLLLLFLGESYRAETNGQKQETRRSPHGILQERGRLCFGAATLIQDRVYNGVH